MQAVTELCCLRFHWRAWQGLKHNLSNITHDFFDNLAMADSAIAHATRKALGERRPPPNQMASVGSSDSMYGSPPKYNHFFLVPLRTFPENVIQIHPQLFELCCRQIDRQTNKLRRKYYLLGGGNYFPPMCNWLKLTLLEKITGNVDDGRSHSTHESDSG